MTRALRIAALFAAYATIGYGGDLAVDLVAQSVGAARPATETEAPRPRVETRDIVVEVRPAIVSRVQVRHTGTCSYEGRRELSLPVSDGDRLAVRAGAGALHVEGREGLDEVIVVGLLCASDEAYLDGLAVSAERSSDGRVDVVTHYPTNRNRSAGRDVARIDLTVLLPRGMAVGVDDSSGDLTVSGTGNLEIDDSSGSIEASDVDGTVRIDDSSGGIDLRDVTGSVEIADGSGGLELQDIGGSVRLRDGSGGIEVVRVEGDLVVEADGSGGIEARDVGGDFIVRRDGSGGIRYSGVAGRIDVPRRR
jgi:hypothetical protein